MTFRWLRVLTLAIRAGILIVLITVLYVVVYSYVIHPYEPYVAGAAQAVPESQAQHAVAVLSASPSADVTVYEIRFDLQLTNRSADAIHVPKLLDDSAGRITGFVLGVQSLQSNGSWRYLNQGSFYGTSTMKYADCSSLGPGANTEINGLVHVFPLPKVRAQELGKEPTLRMDIMIFCREPDGTVLNVTTTTAPFRLRLPAGRV